MHEILKAFAQLRTAFMHANLQPPTAIVLRDYDEGQKFYDATRRYFDEGDLRMFAVEYQPVFKMMDVEVRWPGGSLSEKAELSDVRARLKECEQRLADARATAVRVINQKQDEIDILKDALMKACGDDAAIVRACIDSVS